MHRAFNLVNCKWNSPRESGDTILKQNTEDLKKSLEPFTTGQIVDGTKLADHWFPTIKADVFISHSHKDEEQAIRCAGWLKNTFGLEPFIDSCAWGYAAELLKLIDDKYCRIPDSESYSYEKRNGSTSHVHMMLSTALSSMIDSTECVFFLKSDNSITSSQAVNKTQSPWLFHELATIRVIRRKKPSRQTTDLLENFARGMIKASEAYKFQYEVPLHELMPLNAIQLSNWERAHASDSYQSEHPLDRLYGLFPETP